MTGLLHNLRTDVRVYPHQLDLLNDTVLLVQLSESELLEHSFLDQRVLQQGMNYEWTAWGQFAAVAGAIPPKVPTYIFHIGHCGSTLLSRLISAATATRALREPLPLRSIAFDHADGPAALLSADDRRARLAIFERIWARGAPQTVVKATSMCTNVMELVDPDAAMVFVYQQLEVHLAVVLAGENKLQDLRGFAQNRYRRLKAFDVDMAPLAELSAGELAALSWLAEVVSASRTLTQRSVVKLDFDHFLNQPQDSLVEVCEQLGMNAPADAGSAAVNGPIMRTYSKAPEHEYGPGLRRDIIADSRRRNETAIREAVTWIQRLAATSAVVSAAIEAVSQPR